MVTRPCVRSVGSRNGTTAAVKSAPPDPDNARMTAFYWIMGILIVGTFVPSVLYLVLYATTGEHACLTRARALWNVSRVLTLFGVNLLIWGHVVVGLWQIWF